MTKASKWKFALPLVAWGAWVAMVMTALSQQAVPPPSGLRGESFLHEVFEKDRGKFFPLTHTNTVVDANADLIVSFQPVKGSPAGSPGPDWEQGTNALGFVRDNIRQRVQFTAELARLPLNDSNVVTQFSADLRSFNSNSVRQLRLIRSEAKLTPEEWDRILDGDFDHKPSNRPYENFARW